MRTPKEILSSITGIEIIKKKSKYCLPFDPKQGKYIKLLKLHRSKELIPNNEKEFRIKLVLIPNFELSHKIK